MIELLSRLLLKRDPATLYISINELPNPRSWGTLDFAMGEKLLFSEDVHLVAPSADAVYELMERHGQVIQGCRYQRIVYCNISEWLQERIEEKLHQAGATAGSLCLQTQ